MFVHIWRMRARKKRIVDYEKFGRQVTLPSLKKIDGCLGAHFIKTYQSRRPEYLWLVFWKDHRALEVGGQLANARVAYAQPRVMTATKLTIRAAVKEKQVRTATVARSSGRSEPSRAFLI